MKTFSYLNSKNFKLQDVPLNWKIFMMFYLNSGILSHLKRNLAKFDVFEMKFVIIIISDEIPAFTVSFLCNFVQKTIFLKILNSADDVFL